MKSENLKLRPVEEDDLLDLYVIRSDPAVAAQFFDWRPVTRTGQREWYESIRAPDKLAFVLVGADPTAQGRTEQNQHIVIGFGQIVDIDHRNGTCEVGGFMIRPRLQKRGFGEELVKRILSFCAKDIGMRKVYLEVFEDNEVAIGVYAGLGFKPEGVREAHVWKDGSWRNILMMSLFCDEKSR